MKRFTRCLSFVLVFVLCFGVVAYGQETSTYSSAYFGSFSSNLHKVSSGCFEIWFDVVSAGGMDELGVSSIEVERSSDGRNWIVEDTLYPEDYPNMIVENTGIVYDYVDYYGLSGYFYRAYITYYAKNSRGIGEMPDYTSALYLG